jgi:hypothetical protein
MSPDAHTTRGKQPKNPPITNHEEIKRFKQSFSTSNEENVNWQRAVTICICILAVFTTCRSAIPDHRNDSARKITLSTKHQYHFPHVYSIQLDILSADQMFYILSLQEYKSANS